jgi:1-acyl-sn-glycerol-3-phosphate acyltransferase
VAASGSGSAADPAPAAPATGGAKVRVDAVDVHPPTRLEQGSYRFVRALFMGLAKPYFRLEVVGRENLPPTGSFVMAPVHRSNIDFILAATTHPKRMRYMGKASIWKYPTLGRFFNLLGAFPVHRGTADRESLRTCIRVIENGESLVMFPEGGRRSGPVVDDLFDGAAYVAARSGVPIVPVGIGGSEAAMPPGKAFITPHKIVVVIGEPFSAEVPEGASRAPRRAVREMTDRLHAALQDVFDDARTRAGV